MPHMLFYNSGLVHICKFRPHIPHLFIVHLFQHWMPLIKECRQTTSELYFLSDLIGLKCWYNKIFRLMTWLNCIRYQLLKSKKNIKWCWRHQQRKKGFLQMILTLIFPSCEPDAIISESLLKSAHNTASSCIINASCHTIKLKINNDVKMIYIISKLLAWDWVYIQKTILEEGYALPIVP